jgi:hypothetical protein
MLHFVAAGYSQLYQNKLHFMIEFMKVIDPKVLLYSYKNQRVERPVIFCIEDKASGMG